jgi:multidrug efflux system membrane fusion protein
MRRRYALAVLLSTFAVCLFSGCEQTQPASTSDEPPVVPVSLPVQRVVTDYVVFTGRTDAVNAVDIRARVTGYLVAIPFKEGAEVKKGDTLFEIDPRPYHAQLDQAVSQVELNDASLKLAKTTLSRDESIAHTVAGGVSQQQLDQDRAAVEEAEARLKASRASTKVYRLNVDFTKVTSPVDGQVSRYYYTLGNLVNQDQTLLTTVVSLDPIYAYFDMDEPTLLKIRSKFNREATKKKTQSSVLDDRSVLIGMPVAMALQEEEDYPHEGTINFVNNQFNPGTGSISVRGIFKNPRPAGGARMISPGMFARIRLQIGDPHPALLVVDRAIGFDQGHKFLYVIDAEGKVQQKRVTIGSLQKDGLRVIEKGLEPNEQVVIGALQQVRPKLLVKPDVMAMPTLGPTEDNASGKGGDRSAQKGSARKPPTSGSEKPAKTGE